MGPYAYPIIIDRNKKKIRYSRTIVLDNEPLTLDQLSKMLTPEESFTVYQDDEVYGPKFVLDVTGERLETDEEFKVRIEREEKYMIEYNRRHGK